MRANLIRFLALALVAILMGSCTTAKKEHSTKKNAKHSSEKPTPLRPGQVPSRLLPTLKVTLDPCYVYLRPKDQSPYFGPLVKGEKIKRLDVYGSWIRVWVPRLRESGWVRKSKVFATREKLSSQEGVPENLLSTVAVLTKRANIREAPTTRSRIIFEARKGQEFLLLNEKEGWYLIWIAHLRKKGWIYGKIVAKKGKGP